MGQVITFSNKDSLVNARFLNNQLASKLYHQAHHSKEFERDKFFVDGLQTPRCILFYKDTVVKVEEFSSKELLPTEPVRIKVDNAFPTFNFNRRSFALFPKRYFEPNELSLDNFLEGLAKQVDEDLEEQIRYFVETCDSLGSFEFFSDFNNYYEKGFFLNLFGFLADEYPKASMIDFASRAGPLAENKDDHYYKETIDLYSIGKCLEYQHYSCVPFGWGFNEPWTAKDYSFESTCAIAASIVNQIGSFPSGLVPISCGFSPEYHNDAAKVQLDMFDFTISKQKPVAVAGITYGLRNNEGYVLHNCSFAYEPMSKLEEYLGKLLQSEKPHFFTKYDIESDVVENIRSILDK